MRRERALAILLAGFLCLGAAADPAERLTDPAQEARARHLFKQVRCLVCQNESIDDSEADLAADFRRIVREQVAAGKTDRQITAYLTERYGEFVLFRPSFSAGNAALWLTPFALVALGGIAIVAYRRRGATVEAPLSVEEQERLDALADSSTVATVPPQGDRTNMSEP